MLPLVMTMPRQGRVNSLPALHASRHKLSQLAVAQQLDFTIPKTMAANKPQDVLLFAKSIDSDLREKFEGSRIHGRW